jgi:hypothetical protein
MKRGQQCPGLSRIVQDVQDCPGLSRIVQHCDATHTITKQVTGSGFMSGSSFKLSATALFLGFLGGFGAL